MGIPQAFSNIRMPVSPEPHTQWNDMALDLYNPWIIVAATSLALCTTAVIARWHPPVSGGGRYAAIDGLRGFLAYFVFLHHGSIWYGQIHQQTWQTPASYLFRHLGDSSVALFFMITAFLFTAKVLDSDRHPIDWRRLYVSRVKRLFPLYAVAVSLMWLMAWALTDWTRQISPGDLLAEILNWTLFTIPGGASVNGLPQAKLLMAGVTWSLPYEWWFYCSLPAIAVVLRKQTSHTGWIVFGFANLVLFHAGWKLELRLVPFLGGMLAAYAVRHQRLCLWARSRPAALVVLTCLSATVLYTPTAFSPQALILLSIAFILIACGNDLFGMLSATPSRVLGDMTYSVYLLHGLLLSLVFRWIIGFQTLQAYSIAQYWTLVVALSVPLILLSYATYRWIEVPAQRATPTLARWLAPQLRT
jgi:peptidoglycan/LPS O-acetylase OafA/YrhL